MEQQTTSTLKSKKIKLDFKDSSMQQVEEKIYC